MRSDASRCLDLFGLLGVPVQRIYELSVSASTDDALADEAEWPDEAGKLARLLAAVPGGLGGHLRSLALCKSFVSGVFWDDFSDAEPHRFPHGGLVGGQGEIKPSFDRHACNARSTSKLMSRRRQTHTDKSRCSVAVQQLDRVVGRQLPRLRRHRYRMAGRGPATISSVVMASSVRTFVPAGAHVDRWHRLRCAFLSAS